MLFGIVCSKEDSDIWLALMATVSTKYIYVARDIVRVTWDIRLERLVREMRDFQADVVASSLRTLDTGEVGECRSSSLFTCIIKCILSLLIIS